MRVLSIDVGRGTQDIVVYDGAKNLENCTSLIIPARGKLLERSLRETLAAGKIPFFRGLTMGGFPLFKYAREYLAAGNTIPATLEAAKTFHDDPNALAARGIRIVSREEGTTLESSGRAAVLETKDIDWTGLNQALRLLGENGSWDGLAVAVQDHGEAPPGVSNRSFRFQQHRRMLEKNIDLARLAFKRGDIPPVFTRMRAVARSLPAEIPLLAMDTGWAAILGALEDERVAAAEYKLVVNLGNAHALAALLHKERVLALWEHHTGRLNRRKLRALLEKLAEGRLTHEEVFNDGGHGAYAREKPPGGMARVEIIALTGPNRMNFADQNYYLAAPHGNMMLSGPYGLLRAFRYVYKE